MPIRDTAVVLTALHHLHDTGVRLAMNNFGTGYSSLSCLRKFPFDKIKIDRSFSACPGKEANAEAMVAAIIAVTRALGIRVNAEGVESAAPATMLRNASCSEVQGYFYGQ